MKRSSLLLSLLCVAVAPHSAHAGTGPRPLGCDFKISIPHAKQVADSGLSPAALHAFIRKGNGLGGLRCPQFFKATAGARLYRLWDGRPGRALQYGRSYTMHPYAPKSPEFRQRFAVCNAWNDLSKAFVCEIKAGATAMLAVGPGEQVSREECRNGQEFYRESADPQVLLISDPAKVCK